MSTDEHRGPPVLPAPAGEHPAAPSRAAPPEESELSSLGLPVSAVDTCIVIILTVLADFLLYKAPGGTGAACLLPAVVAGLFAASRAYAAKKHRLLPFIVLIAAGMMVWRHWWLLETVAWTSIFIMTVGLKRPDWHLPETLYASGWTVAAAPFRLLGHMAPMWTIPRRKEDASRDRGPGLSPRVVLVPLAVCVIFILIFSAANPVIRKIATTFGENIGRWIDMFGEFLSPDRVFIWTLWLTLFAGLIRPVVRSIVADWQSGLDESLQPMADDWENTVNCTTAFATLVSVNILFLAYNCMDSVYLYFKAALPAGITWTDYTHAGCAWLTLGLFVSTVVIGITFRRSLNFHPRSNRLKLLAYIWAAQNWILAVGAIRRLQMYIDYSGLTHLLITGLYGSILVAVGLGIMVGKVRGNRTFIWLVRKDLIAFCIGLCVLAFTPNQWICAAYNVRKVLEEKHRAMRPICLKNLAAEALPPLIPLLDYERADDNQAKEKLVREGIAAILGEHLDRLEKAEQNKWTQWQGSEAWALKHLRPIKDKIHSIVPAEHWSAARQRLVNDYDIECRDVEGYHIEIRNE